MYKIKSIINIYKTFKHYVLCKFKSCDRLPVIPVFVK